MPSDEGRARSAARRLIERVAPPEWRDSLVGDLAEEAARRRRAGKPAGAWWALAAAASLCLQLRLDRRRSTLAMPAPRPRFVDACLSELSQAVRAVWRRPAFAAVTIATLTLGIGANTIVFSLANWLIFRPVPGVDRPDELVTIRQEIQTGGFYTMTVPDVRALAALPGVASLAGHAAISVHVSTPGGVPARVEGEIATSNYFAALGQGMTLGRAFGPAEDDPGAADVLVISHRMWRSELGGDPSVLGRAIGINGHPFAVIGVAAPGFRGPDRTGRADLWVPLASFRESMPGYPQDLLGNSRVGVFLSVLGRLAPGATIAQVNQQAEALRGRLLTAAPGPSTLTRAHFIARAGLDVPVWQRDGLRQTMRLLLAVVGFLLLLTCANVANLMFAHAHARHAELATRQALGATRARVARQLLLEGLVLACGGGVAALALAAWAGSFVDGLVVARTIPALSKVDVDWRVFAFTGGVSLAACLGASWLPAMMGSRVDVATSLKAAGRGQTPGGRRVRGVLTVVQVAVSVTLLCGGLLLVRSVLARYAVPLGFETRNVLAFSIEPGLEGRSDAQTRQFFGDLLDRIRAQPGVGQAGLAWVEPFRLIGGGSSVRLEGQPEKDALFTDSNMMSAGFFPSIGATFVAGRDFTDAETFRSDANGNGVVIANATLAKALFGTTDVIGRRVRTSYPEDRARTIVGVVADIRTRNLTAAVGPVLYQPFGQSFLSGWGTVHVKLTAPAAVVVPELRGVVRALDPNLPIYDLETLRESVDRYLADDRLVTACTVTFALLATALAAVGLYGVLSRGVAERRREFGVRAALGAGPAAIARLVTGDALRMVAAGVVAGLAATVWLGRYLASWLFGVSAVDPVSVGSAIVAMVVVALAAAIGPARRAARIDCAEELR